MTDHDLRRIAQAWREYCCRADSVANIRGADWHDPETCYLTKLERISRDSLDSLLKEIVDARQTKPAP